MDNLVGTTISSLQFPQQRSPGLPSGSGLWPKAQPFASG
jgi:hypothetical protein